LRYIGGKQRQAKQIAYFVNKAINKTNADYYIEPFCGALSVAYEVAKSNKKPTFCLYDYNEALITMWRAFFELNFEFPNEVNEETYKHYKSIRDSSDPMTAFVGFGCSFSCKWFGGYARGRTTNYADETVRSMNRLKPTFDNLKYVFHHSSYQDIQIPDNSVLYLDPPYAGRTQAYGVPKFNHGAFWEWARKKALSGTPVIVTEFNVPKDFVVLWNYGDTVVRHYHTRGSDGTNEVVACHESQMEMFK